MGGPSSGLYPYTDMSATSILDLFLVTERLVPLVDRCKALHLGDNMSRHSPILLKLRVGEIPTKKKVASSIPRKPNWQKATGDVVANYKTDLQQKLESSPLPESLSCVDLDVGCRVADVFMGPLDSVTTYCCWLPLGTGYSLCWIFARDSLPSTAYSFPLTPIL